MPVNCFNPRPREGGDVLFLGYDQDLRRVSIHAPVKGATVNVRGLPYGTGSFNPRPREGGDVRIIIKSAGVASVSIHAPVKGATQIRRAQVDVK